MGSPGEDIAVIMCGYRPQMLQMLREQNPGLRSRFDPSNAFSFDDYSDLELLSILSSALGGKQVRAPIATKLHAVKLLAKRRTLPNFGNARAVKSLVANSVQRMESRLTQMPGQARQLELDDVEEGASKKQDDPLRALEKLKGYGRIEEEMRSLGGRLRVLREEGHGTEGLVGNFIFTGTWHYSPSEYIFPPSKT